MKGWDLIRKLWTRLKHGKPLSKDASRKERSYHELIEQLETGDRKSTRRTPVESTGRYHVRPYTKK